MKTYSLLQAFCLCILFSLAVACNNNYASHCANGVMDGNETGIDCGGDCPNCPTSGIAPDPLMFGNWYILRSIQEYGNLGQFNSFSFTLYSSPLCRWELKNNILNNTYNYVTYEAYGGAPALGYGCNYPQPIDFNWSYFKNFNYIYKLTNDSLIILPGLTPALYNNKVISVKSGNPYVGANTYLRFRMEIINYDGPANGIACWTGFTGGQYLGSSQGQSNLQMISPGTLFVEAVLDNATAGGVQKFYLNRTYTDISNGYQPGPSVDYTTSDKHIEFRYKVFDENGIVLYTSPVYKKIVDGAGYNTNPFVNTIVTLTWM